jgi:hypothetical protein
MISSKKKEFVLVRQAKLSCSRYEQVGKMISFGGNGISGK